MQNIFFLVIFTFQCHIKRAQDKQVGFLQLNRLLLLFVERKKIRTFHLRVNTERAQLKQKIQFFFLSS